MNITGASSYGSYQNYGNYQANSHASAPKVTPESINPAPADLQKTSSPSQETENTPHYGSKVNQPGNPSETQAQKTSDSNQTDTAQDADKTKKSEEESNRASSGTEHLNQAEKQLVSDLKQADTMVRQHEMAHISAGGQYITSGASFTYKKGPDGQNYAVAGEVGIDTSSIPGDPKATAQKMARIKSAALAPASPSSQDLKVASKASSIASKALSDLMALQAKEQADANEKKAFGTPQTASDSYEKVKNLPEENTASFQIAI
jgi:hypothetical protein